MAHGRESPSEVTVQYLLYVALPFAAVLLVLQFPTSKKSSLESDKRKRG